MFKGSYTSYVNRKALRNEKQKKEAHKDDEIDEEEYEDETISSSSEEEDEELLRRFVLRRRSDVEMTEEMREMLAKIKKAKRVENLQIMRNFLLGIALSHLIFFFISLKREWSKVEAFINGILGFVIATAMAFSESFFCVVLLMGPSFCTKTGRSIVLLYIAFVITNGPVVNIRTNYHQLTNAMTCGDELAFNATRGLRTVFNEGQVAVLNSMEHTVDVVVSAIDKVELLFMDFKEKVKYIEAQIKKLTSWIFDVGKICERRIAKFFCIIPSIIAREAYNLFGKKIHRKVKSLLNEFRFTLNYTYDFQAQWNVSKTSLQVAREISADINERFQAGEILYNWLSTTFSFAFIIILYRAVRYRNGYLSALDYDNVYITKRFIEFDQKRQKRNRNYILPLNRRELTKYVKPTSWMLTRVEITKFGRGFTLLFINLLYACAIFFADFFCYLLLKVMVMLVEKRQVYEDWKDEVIRSATEELRKSGTAEANMIATLASLDTRLNVKPGGFVSDIYNSILDSINQVTMTQNYQFSLDKCAPKPTEPDWGTHILIFSLYGLCYLMTLFQSYILRMRRAIMASFNKRRERMRIGFLQAKIWKNRGTALNSDLRWLVSKAEEKSEDGKSPRRDGIVRGLLLMHRLTRMRCFEDWARKRMDLFECYVCRSLGKDEEVFVTCGTLNCETVYCTQCFQQLHSNCIVCLQKSKRYRDRDDEDSDSEDFILSSSISDSSESESSGDEETRV